MSTTYFIQVDTAVRSLSPAFHPCGTSPPFRCSPPYPGTGYGFDDETKEMLGGYTWGDSHHPAFSETGGEYDGRWLFINDNAQGRIARIDLRDFKVKQILGVPNVSANHGSSFVSPNTEQVTMATRMSIPIPAGTYADVDKYATDYKGVVAGIKVDPEDGEMTPRLAAVGTPLQLRPRRCRQGSQRRLVLLDLLQLGA